LVGPLEHSPEQRRSPQTGHEARGREGEGGQPSAAVRAARLTLRGRPAVVARRTAKHPATNGRTPAHADGMMSRAASADDPPDAALSTKEDPEWPTRAPTRPSSTSSRG
jgi:hypothetical protein